MIDFLVEEERGDQPQHGAEILAGLMGLGLKPLQLENVGWVGEHARIGVHQIRSEIHGVELIMDHALRSWAGNFEGVQHGRRRTL